VLIIREVSSANHLTKLLTLSGREFDSTLIASLRLCSTPKIVTVISTQDRMPTRELW
jgi:hypothetical protein